MSKDAIAIRDVEMRSFCRLNESTDPPMLAVSERTRFGNFLSLITRLFCTILPQSYRLIFLQSTGSSVCFRSFYCALMKVIALREPSWTEALI